MPGVPGCRLGENPGGRAAVQETSRGPAPRNAIRNQEATMRIQPLVASVALALSLAAAHAETTVAFEHPDRYFDAGELQRDVRDNRAVIEQMLVDFGRRYLKADDVLQITVTDIDLAGRARFHSTGPNEVRILRGGADWPRITLRYVWTSEGRTAGPVDEMVADQNYLTFGPPPDNSRPLPYERRMLERWFKERFVEARPPPQKSGALRR
jgi:Protein of unknown function (DUF3016)